MENNEKKSYKKYGSDKRKSFPSDKRSGDHNKKRHFESKDGESKKKNSFSDKPRFDKKNAESKKQFNSEKRTFNGDKKPFAKSNDRRFDSKRSFKNDVKKNDTVVLDNRIEIALQALIDVEKNGKYINLAFKNNDKLDRLEKKDRAYVMRILYGVTEKSFTVDWLLSKVLSEKRIKPWLNAILRIGTYQIYYMRIEDKDAIAQASEACKKYVSPELCGFVTAVLSKLSENKSEYDPETYIFKSTAERLSVIYSYPQWLIEMWMKDYDEDTLYSLLNGAESRSINLRISKRAQRAALMQAFDEAEIKYSDGILYNTISINDTVNVETLDAYKEGIITPQGVGSMLTVDALSVSRDSTVLDACAAPGGKTFYIAEKTTMDVESCDIHEHRVELIRKGAQRLHLENVNAVCRDSSVSVPEYIGKFDRVLLDVPCSGLGMVNSKPDIKNNANIEEIEALSAVQATILETCSEYVKEGGILVYSTCTVTKAENNKNIAEFLKKHSEFELIDIDKTIPDVLNYITEDKTVLLLPSKYNSDAFFIAALRRV